MKKNDVFKWSYKSIEGMFEPYWCKARICILREKEDGTQYLEDIYGLSVNKTFELKDAEDHLDLIFLGNLDDFELKEKHNTVYYNECDIMDLTHSNSYGTKIYIRKGAKKDLEKMRRVIQAHINFYKFEADYAMRMVDNLQEDLQNLSEDSYIPYNEQVYIGQC